MIGDPKRDTLAEATERRQARLAAARFERRRAKAGKPRKRRRTRAWRRARRDERYLDWIRSLPCAACGSPPRSHAHHEPPRSNATEWHDRSTIPLCHGCHETGATARHHIGSLAAFEAAHGLGVATLISRLNAVHDRCVRPKETSDGQQEEDR